MSEEKKEEIVNEGEMEFVSNTIQTAFLDNYELDISIMTAANYAIYKYDKINSMSVIETIYSNLSKYTTNAAIREIKLYSMEAVMYNTAEEKRSARNRLIVIKTAIEEQMRQRMTKMEW